MQTHKRLIARILSLVLTSSMVLTTLPLNVLASEEISGKTEIIQETDKENSETGGLASFNTDGTGGETTGLGVENTDAGNETVDTTLNDYDLAKIEGDVEIDGTDKGSCEKDPHEISGKTDAYGISVKGGTHWIKLNGVSIDVSEKVEVNSLTESTTQGKSAFAISTQAEVHLELARETTNTLKSGSGRAGLEVQRGGDRLVINGAGTLNATGGSSAAGIGCGNGGEIEILGGTITAIGGSEAAGIDIGEKKGGSIHITYFAKVIAVSTKNAIVPGASAAMIQLDFAEEVLANSKIEILKNNSSKAFYTPTINFKSIAFSLTGADTYNAKITTATDEAKYLGHGDESSLNKNFTVVDNNLSKYDVKVGTADEPTPEPEPEPDNPTPTPDPTPNPPSTGGSSSNTSNNIGAEGTESGSSVKVTTTRTPEEVKNIIEDKYIIDTIEIKKAEEPVKIKIKVDKKKTKDIFVLQTNPETKKVELVAKSEVDNKGYAEFMSDSKEKMTIVTQLNTGFIDTVETIVKPSVTYYVDETQTFKKGWFKLEDKDWYFADYKNEEIQKNRWVADGEDSNKLAKWYYLGEDGVMFEGKWIANNADGTKWYYVDQNGLFLRDTVIDGYVINSEGYWSK